MSGDEPFNKIVLPLVKALQFKQDMDHKFRRLVRSLPTLALCIAVLDAPMLLVESPSKAGDPVLTPWVRVQRMQANHDRDSTPRSHEVYAIDFVHLDTLDDFLNNHVSPFADEFARRSVALGSIWRHGGIVRDLNNFKWDEITPKQKH